MKKFILPAFPILENSRLRLRALRPEDAANIFYLRADDAHNKYLHRSKAHTMEDALQFIDLVIRKVAEGATLFWVIELKESAAFAGTILLWNNEDNTAETETGYELLPQHQGKGIMTEALGLVLVFAFTTLALPAVTACVHKDNFSSIKLLRSHSFQFEGAVDECLYKFILASTRAEKISAACIKNENKHS